MNFLSKSVTILLLGTAFFGCKAETETEYVDRIVEKEVPVYKEYAAAVTFTATTNDDGTSMTITMTSETEHASIYYTTDDTTPTAESTKYTSPITVSENTTYKAIAVKEDMENSPVSVAAVSITEKTVEVEVEKIVEVDKKADETAPATVTGLESTAKDSRVLLTWTDAADSDIYGYEVSYTENTPARVLLSPLDERAIMVSQGAGGCYVSGLTNGTAYTFTVKSVDTSGNKSAGVMATATPVAVDASDAMKIVLRASVPQENGYTGSKSNTKVTVTANITTASTPKKVVWKKNGSLIAKTLLADTDATEATVDDLDNATWTFDIEAIDESANGTYTVAAIDAAGREEAEQIIVDQFDFTPPKKVQVTNAVYSSDLAVIILNWTEPSDQDYDHVSITYTSNDGIHNSDASEAVHVAKGITNKTFSDIDSSKAYYKYTFVTYDAVGNEGATYTYGISVNASVSYIPEGFVAVTGATVSGAISGSSVFISGRTITIPDMYVCDHEVTQEEYETYCRYGTNTDGNNVAPRAPYGIGEDYPAYYVNWYDAIVYCNLRSMAENVTPAYAINGETDPSKWTDIVSTTTNNVTKYCGPPTSNTTWDSVTCDFTASGYRLPREAEWEYIARGGNDGIPSKQYAFSGSDTIDEVAWYSDNAYKVGVNSSDYGTHKVKTKAANTLGIYDMTGNVYEWCYDWWGHPLPADTGVSGPSSGSVRITRSSSWQNGISSSTVAERQYSYSYPRSRDYYTGFRIVRTVQ